VPAAPSPANVPAIVIFRFLGKEFQNSDFIKFYNGFPMCG
jgi:hypothetical protein